jgi:hypothetical protein
MSPSPVNDRVKPGEGSPTVHPDRALGFIYAAAFTPLTTTTPKQAAGARIEETALGSNKETDRKGTGAHRVSPSLMQLAPAGVSTASKPAGLFPPRAGGVTTRQ